MQDHNLGCPQRAAEKTFFIHEGSRRTTEKTFARSSFGLSTKGRGENLFVHEGPRRTTEKTFARSSFGSTVHEGPRRKPFCPRRATKDHGENLCKVIIWAVYKGPRRKPFCPRRATKDHEENLCKVIIWAVYKGPRRKPFCPRRATKDHEENLCKVIICHLQGHNLGCPRWAVKNAFFNHEGPRRKPFVVDSDYGLRAGESGEKRSGFARRRPVLSQFEQSSPNFKGT